MERPTPHRALSRGLYEQLIERNLDNFDWINGGQSGPIKFIDLHQFEFAIRRSREGSLVATLMVNLILKGICNLIVPEHGGACQYSTGAQWNGRNRLITLAGQAIALQALALGANLRRRRTEFKLGSRINLFVEANAQEIGLLLRTVGRIESDLAAGTQLRDNTWYAIGLHQFGDAYDNAELILAARRLFESIITIKPADVGSSAGQSLAGPYFKLDRIVAMMAALAYFGVTYAKPKLLHLANSLICGSVLRYAHAEGGFAQVNATQTATEAGIDIDCTIDLVRTCLALLRLIPDRRIWSIAQHGLCALFDPAVALARRPETGILLVASELAEVCALGAAPVEEATI